MGICLIWSSDECKKAVSKPPKPASSTPPTLRNTAAIHRYETRHTLSIGMGCAERDRLLDLLLAALKAHSDAVGSYTWVQSRSLDAGSQVGHKSRGDYRDCCEALIAHERLHGCAPRNFLARKIRPRLGGSAILFRKGFGFWGRFSLKWRQQSADLNGPDPF